MARKLKTFQTSLGFYDLAIAAPSMNAALEAWGAGSNLFHQGAAKETDDPDVVAATMSKPGVVLKRPAGSNGRFAEQSDLPSDLGSADKGRRREGRRPESAKRPPAEISDRDARKAAAEFE
jgi:colicin import membrane protein